MSESFHQNILFLLDKSHPFSHEKLKILESICDCLYFGKDTNLINLANQTINQLKNNQDFWFSTDFIFENSQNPNTKFLSLIILEETIKTRWNILPENQKEALKSYIMNMIIKFGSMENLDRNLDNLLKKFNVILVQVVKYEWKTTWRNFIPEICGASKTNQNLCENNFEILKLLSEEIFDFSKNQMTSAQIKELKDQMIQDFSCIMELCLMILRSFVQNQGIKQTLIKVALETLYAFMSWIPLYYIFTSDLIENALLPLVEHQQLRNLSIKCLTEIVLIPFQANNSEESKQFQEKILLLFTGFIMRIEKMLLSDISLLKEREKTMKNAPKSITAFDNLCQNLCMFFTGLFQNHLSWIEVYMNNQDNYQLIESIRKGFNYVVNFSELPEDQIFKICVEFWFFFTDYLKKQKNSSNIMDNQPLLLITQQFPTLAANIYPNILTQVRKIMISRMAKPQEVLIVIDENGLPTKEIIKDSEVSALYEIMKELMINLTILDWENTKMILNSKLEKQLDGSEWSFDNINSLCWAIGSISGTLKDNEEKVFLINVIRTLLNLTEMKKGKENKAVVASNIMYVVGQYPKFLRANWNFLKTVVKKLFEFMHEPFPGVMEMACNTFLKIATTCKQEFVILHSTNEDMNFKAAEPYVYDLIRRIPEETNMLDNGLKLVFFEAVGLIIGAQTNLEEKKRHLSDALKGIIEEWNLLMLESNQNSNRLLEENIIESTAYFLKVNERLSFSVGCDYQYILNMIYDNIINVYTFFSRYITQQLLQTGKYILNNSIIKKLKGIRRDIIKLISTYLQSTDNPDNIKNYVPRLLDILEDFRVSAEDTKEPEVLLLFALVIEKLKITLAELVPKILELVFSSILDMITRDFHSYPDHRRNFFTFLKAVINNAFIALFAVPVEQFRTIINCVIWAFQHNLPELYELGLDILIVILTNVHSDQGILNQFHQIYYLQLLTDIIMVLTDSFHKSGFRTQVNILGKLLEILDGPLTISLNDQGIDNKTFVYNYMVDQLVNRFPNVSKIDTERSVARMFQTATNHNELKIAIRDYLVQLTNFSQNIEILYGEEEKNNNNN